MASSVHLITNRRLPFIVSTSTIILSILIFLSIADSIKTDQILLSSASSSMAFRDSETSFLIDQQTTVSMLNDFADQKQAAKRSIYELALNRHNDATSSSSFPSTLDVDYTSFDSDNNGQHYNDGSNHDQHQHQNNDEQLSEDTSSSTNHSSSTTLNRHQLPISINNDLPQQSPKNFLTRGLIDETCKLDRGSQREEHIQDLYLSHCSRYKLENLLSSELLDSIMHRDSKVCSKVLDEFVQLDEVVEQFDRLFMNLLTRYNCHNGYSVKWSCDDCKRAYTDWICATHLPFYMNAERIKPCISFCERVEQRCPYLHPITREQYGGQPVFICQDPNIPFLPKITPEMPYNEQGQCYDLCHLSENLTELITDSLSKYDYDKCPDKNSIAGLVKANPHYCAGTCVEQKRVVDVHKKKLDELREVLANYKNQAKTHRYHADHSSIHLQQSSNWSI